MTANPTKQRAADFFVFSAAAVFPALAWISFPLLSIIAVLIIPVPLALLVRRLDLRYGLAALLLMILVLTAAAGNPRPALLLAMQTGPLGLLLGLLFKNHVSSGKALIITASFSLAVSLSMFLAGYLLTGASPFTLNERQRYVFDQERRLIHQMFGQGGPAGGMDPATVNELEAMVSQVEAMWPVLSISSVLIWFTVSAGITLLITRRVMVRYGYTVPPALPFTRWRLPWYVIWGVIGGLALMLGGDYARISGLVVSGKAVLWLMGFVLSVIGLSVCVFYLKRWKVAWPFKLLVFVMMGMYLPVTAGVLVTAGITDTIWNIRRLTPDGRTPEEEDKK